ncbi:hypothetical protein J4G48_0003460 [Bradyrhizobium barranii subsp. apii]|uniref:hypothetical protein n=1 Tax=Bradyrhizobium barranii TaxID=2992140 RepID=UPI001AA0CD4F|nr:hypothetical protein [Bradyrhizobium barranii]UPT97253.1 hypothetical protein J4G48_0003460 [Bradyrhizobium barranii subsp. apii]
MTKAPDDSRCRPRQQQHLEDGRILGRVDGVEFIRQPTARDLREMRVAPGIIITVAAPLVMSKRKRRMR